MQVRNAQIYAGQEDAQERSESSQHLLSIFSEISMQVRKIYAGQKERQGQHLHAGP